MDVMVMLGRGSTQSEVSKILICDLDKEYPSYPAKSGGFSDFWCLGRKVKLLILGVNKGGVVVLYPILKNVTMAYTPPIAPSI